MPRQNLEELEKKIKAKQKKREAKQRPRMRVSGAKVKDLQRIIKNK